MDRETLKNISLEEYRDCIEKVSDEEVDIFLNTNKGHSREFHSFQSDAQMLERLVSENKEAVSSFYDEEQLRLSISDAICFKAEDIATWFTKGYKEFNSPDEYRAFAFSVDIGEDIGNGFDEKYQEKATSVIRLVLQRDVSGESPFGFFVKTAYADIMNDLAYYTGKKYSKNQVLQNSDLKISPVQKMREEAKEIAGDANIFLQKCNGQEQLKIRFSEEVTVYLSENNISIRINEEDNRRKIGFDTCMIEYPDIANKIGCLQALAKEHTANQYLHSIPTISTYAPEER